MKIAHSRTGSEGHSMKLGHSSGITLSVNGHRKSVFFTTRNPEEWERHIAFLQTEIRLGPGIKHVDWEKVGRTLCPETDWTKVRCTFVSAPPNTGPSATSPAP
jgi:hypothetical protein